MPETFNPATWADGSGGGTPITAAQLNRIEAGIESMDDRVTTLEGLGGAVNVGSGTSVPVLREVLSDSEPENGTTTLTLTTSGNVVTGDTVVAVHGADWNAATGMNAPTGNMTGWVQHTTEGGATNSAHLKVWSATASTDGTQTITVNKIAAGSDAYFLAVYVFIGPILVEAAAAGQVAAATTHAAPAVTSGGANRLLLCAFQTMWVTGGGSTTYTSAPSGMTQRTLNAEGATVSGDGAMLTATQPITAAGSTGTRTATYNASRAAATASLLLVSTATLNGYATVQDEGAPRPERGVLNFVGAGVTVTDDTTASRTVVTIPGGSGGTAVNTMPVLNVKVDYGAVGNGSADDTVALQNALNAVPFSGAIVYFPPGTYLVPNGGLTCANTVHLRGQPGLDGPGSRIKTTATNSTALTLSDEGCTMTGMTFVHDLTGTRSTGLIGVNFTHADFIRVEHCLFQGWSTCLKMTDGLYFSVSHNEFRDFVVAGLDISAPVSPDRGDMVVDGNSFTRASDTITGGTAVLWHSSSGLRFIGNKINGAFNTLPLQHGVQLQVADGATCVDLMVVGNSIENFSGNAVGITKEGTTGIFNLGVTIVGNQIAAYSETVGTGVFVNTATSGVTVCGNTFFGMLNGVDVDNIIHSSISGNSFDGITGYGVRVRSGCNNVHVPPQPINLYQRAQNVGAVVYDDSADRLTYTWPGSVTADRIRTGQVTTAGRPNSGTAGVGTMLYDTTLGKPIWSTGAGWKDAAGNNV